MMAARPHQMARATLLLLLPLCNGLLVLFDQPPRGYNTFDAYGYAWLNATSTIDLIRTLADSPLHAAGYTQMYGFSGWSQAATGTNAWSLDGWGRPVPNPDRFPPGSMQAAAKVAQSLGLQFGLWHIRGIHAAAAAAKLPVKGMEQYTLDQLVDQQPTGGGANGSCLWDSQFLGVNASHPAAQAYYDSIVEQLVDLGASVIEADCFMCAPCYTDEMTLFSRAVKARPEKLTLYFSPGGGNEPGTGGRFVADGQMASYYRVITDFHGGWYDWAGLQQACFIAANFSIAGLNGANGTWADLDQLPMNAEWWAGDQEQSDRGQTIATLWVSGRYPLMSAGSLPLDARTLSYLTNPLALALNARTDAASPTLVLYEGNCTCTGGSGSCTIPHGPGDHPARPCVQKWIAAVAPDFTALALINLGEDNATSATALAELRLPAAGRFRVTDVWSGAEVGVFGGGESFSTQLRKHASALLRVAPV